LTNAWTTQLAIYARGVTDRFEVTEDLLTVNPMYGQTTAEELFQHLCDAIRTAGMHWERMVGKTTDSTPSTLGRKTGQENWRRRVGGRLLLCTAVYINRSFAARA